MKVKRKQLKGVVVVVLAASILTMALYEYFSSSEAPAAPSWSVSKDGIVSFSPVAAPKYAETVLEDTDNHTLSKISYESFGQMIYALLYMRRANKSDAFIILPGALIKKEGEQESLGSFLNDLGYSTFVLDQRGIGETDGPVDSLEIQFMNYTNNQTPLQYKMIYDVLLAHSILRSKANIDKIYIAGESMGGRFAIMAAAIEPDISGLMGISTAGYNIDYNNTTNVRPEAATFIHTLDPDSYIGLISSRKAVMIHSINDTMIPIDMAGATFSKAKDPKKFLTGGITHGFTKEMKPYVLVATLWLARTS